VEREEEEDDEVIAIFAGDEFGRDRGMEDVT
jgi:hypothetical protein